MSDQEHPELGQVLAAVRSAGTQATGSAWTVTREVAALDHLTHHLGRERYLPPLGGWSIDYSTLAYLLDLLRRRGRPVRLLELGSGAGTPWTASIVAHVGGEMISVEHDEEFTSSTQALLEHYDLTDTCRVVHAPLTTFDPDHADDATEGPAEEATRWYSVPAILDALEDTPVDVLVVDGPPGTTAPLARRPALTVLAGHLADGAIVLLDDTVRDEEQEIFRLWQEELGARFRPLPRVATRARAATYHRPEHVTGTSTGTSPREHP